ncbi:MAG TPA: hypothetical protein VFR05_06255 [Terriglobia bacterium]|nr:hypothetical protein [Terriglobia bacterium]
MCLKRARRLLILTLLVAIAANGQDRRDHTRPNWNTATAVTESQAADLTLTLTEAAIRPVQTWIRTAATIDGSRKVLTAKLNAFELPLVKAGQRVRAFPPDARSSIYQARITRVTSQAVEAVLTGPGRENSTYYVMEIVVDRGRFLSIPNEAIIEEGDKHVVYVQQHPGHYVPQEVRIGIQGEVYAQVLDGLKEGDQIVTFGSFFIDAEHKLKTGGEPAMSNGHQHN